MHINFFLFRTVLCKRLQRFYFYIFGLFYAFISQDSRVCGQEIVEWSEGCGIRIRGYRLRQMSQKLQANHISTAISVFFDWFSVGT